jgi:transcriptional regulator with XRE-family HTH domain
MERSPIREIRHRRGWRAADLAAFADISLSAVTMVERGELTRLPARLESALIRLGEDIAEVRQRHVAFIQTRRRALVTDCPEPTD